MQRLKHSEKRGTSRDRWTVHRGSHTASGKRLDFIEHISMIEACDNIKKGSVKTRRSEKGSGKTFPKSLCVSSIQRFSVKPILRQESDGLYRSFAKKKKQKKKKSMGERFLYSFHRTTPPLASKRLIRSSVKK